MAAKKLYVVKTTAEYRDKNGDKKRLLRGPEPQAVPSDLVKELTTKGVIEAAAARDDDEAAGTGEGEDGGTGAGNE